MSPLLAASCMIDYVLLTVLIRTTNGGPYDNNFKSNMSKECRYYWFTVCESPYLALFALRCGAVHHMSS